MSMSWGRVCCGSISVMFRSTICSSAFSWLDGRVVFAVAEVLSVWLDGDVEAAVLAGVVVVVVAGAGEVELVVRRVGVTVVGVVADVVVVDV